VYLRAVLTDIFNVDPEAWLRRSEKLSAREVFSLSHENLARKLRERDPQNSSSLQQ